MNVRLQNRVRFATTGLLLWMVAGNLQILAAQLPAPAPPDLQNPEVNIDRTATFHLRAPAAHQVVLWGEWMRKGSDQPMARDEQGVWSSTVGPLRPDVYLYAFGVDGVRLADPGNRHVKNGYPGLASVLEVPGPESEFLAIHDVPHGTVHIDYYRSTPRGTMRRVHVYTPPGFARSKRSHSTLYLLHGSWDTDADWSGIGRAGIILDNLIAQRKAVPMLIVMPDGHPFPSFDASTRPENLALLNHELMEDVLPFVEQRYGASPKARDRAIAGISMGGTQALHIGLQNLNRFGAIGVMSAPGDVPNSEPFATAQADVLQNASEINAQLQLFWLACGRDDDLVGQAKKVDQTLSEHGIRHVWRETEGAHMWMTWRRHLAELAPLLFRR
jgi:enterochelin esterase-like enzyme